LLKLIFPDELFKFPAIKLNNVVLPEPLGPITPVMLSFLTEIEQSDTAASPPKFFDKFLISRIFSDTLFI
jgi:hypothetical protein